jgi:hypothetical protein
MNGIGKLAPNGKIYCIVGGPVPPASENYYLPQCLLEIDVIRKITKVYYTNNTSLFGPYGTYHINDLVLHPNGKLYTIPSSGSITHMLEIDVGAVSADPNMVFSPYFNKC